MRKSIDFALNVSLARKKSISSDSTIKQFVASIALVKGVPFYGYNIGWRLYCKVYLYNPKHIRRLSDLLFEGAVMKRRLQPYEAHINFTMQFLIDFNLYGCGFLECDTANLKFRRYYQEDCSDDEYDYNCALNGYHTLPEDVYPQHTYCGLEVDIHAKHILNRKEVIQRNLHQDFGERNMQYDDGFKHLHSLKELWKTHAEVSRAFETDGEEDYTIPSTSRGGIRHKWLQESEYRGRINDIVRAERRASNRNPVPLIRRIANEKYIPTSFESVNYIWSFGADITDEAQLLGAQVDVDVGIINLLQNVDDRHESLTGGKGGEEYLDDDENFSDIEPAVFDELDRRASNSFARTEANTSGIEYHEKNFQPDFGPILESENGETPNIPPASVHPDTKFADPNVVWEKDLDNYVPFYPSNYSEISQKEIPTMLAAFEINPTRTVLYIPQEPPARTAASRLLEEDGISPVIYDSPYYGKISDLPNKPLEYGGARHKLLSHDYTHLPYFDPLGKAKHATDTSNVFRPTKLMFWKITAEPPSRSEVGEWTSQNSISNGASMDPVNTHISQIEGPTQENKHGFRYIGQQNTSRYRVKKSQMSVMSLEVHVNSRGSLVPNPERDPISCVFWCIQFERLEELETGILVIKTGNVDEDTFRRLANVGQIYMEDDEMCLINTLVDIVRDIDPDILTGYEVHSSSWGYIISRAMHLNGFVLYKELSRVKVHAFGLAGKDVDEWGFNKAAAIRVTGRHVINIWRAMRGELNLLGYKLENVVYHLLNRRIPHYSFQTLTEWYNSENPRFFTRVLNYFLVRVKLDLEILERQELIARIRLDIDF